MKEIISLKDRFNFTLTCCAGYIAYAPEAVTAEIRKLFSLFILYATFIPLALLVAVSYAAIGIAMFVLILILQTSTVLRLNELLNTLEMDKRTQKSAENFAA